MKVALSIFVILTFTVNLNKAGWKDHLDKGDRAVNSKECMAKCPEEDKTSYYYCTLGKDYANKCHFDCNEGKDTILIQCKGYARCYNECPEIERKYTTKKVCEDGEPTAWGMCGLKCYNKIHQKNKKSKIEWCPGQEEEKPDVKQSPENEKKAEEEINKLEQIAASETPDDDTTEVPTLQKKIEELRSKQKGAGGSPPP